MSSSQSFIGKFLYFGNKALHIIVFKACFFLTNEEVKCGLKERKQQNRWIVIHDGFVTSVKFDFCDTETEAWSYIIAKVSTFGTTYRSLEVYTALWLATLNP
jgi:hypothetical protein